MNSSTLYISQTTSYMIFQQLLTSSIPFLHDAISAFFCFDPTFLIAPWLVQPLSYNLQCYRVHSLPLSLPFSTHLVISFGLMIFKRHPYTSTTSKYISLPKLTFSIILLCLTAYEATWMSNRHTSTLICSKPNTKSLSSNLFHHRLLQFKVSNSYLPTFQGKTLGIIHDTSSSHVPHSISQKS